MRSRALRPLAFLLMLGLIAVAYASLRPARLKRQIRATVHALQGSGNRPPAEAVPPRSRVARRPAAAGAPNVLLVLVDTLRADHLGAYGYGRPTSPFIDSLAAEGVVFEKTIAQAPWTLPAVLALMMGEYPSDLGLPSPTQAVAVLPEEGLTLAERFLANGYRTVALSDHPAIAAGGFGRGFERFDSLPEGPFGRWGFAETEAATIHERWSRLLVPTDDRPTFAYVHLYYPHSPYEPPPPLDVLFGPGALLVRESFRTGVVNLYDGEIRRTDELLRLMVPQFQRLAATPEGSVTAIVSDHGEAFWEHGVLGHDETMHNELLHVPFVLHAPGRVPGGARIRELAQTVDIGETLLAIAGAGSPGDAPRRGRALLTPASETDPPEAERWAMSESPVRGPQTRSIQTASLKVIRSGADAVAYRLSDDPMERRPLSLEAVPGAARLNQILDAIPAPARFKGRLDADAAERLRAQGYVFGGGGATRSKEPEK